MSKKPLPKRQKALRRRMRQDPFGRLAIAIGDYLDTIGWSAVIVGRPRIQQQPLANKFNYEFVLDFSGSQKKVEK